MPHEPNHTSDSVFRIDKYFAPPEALPALLERLRHIQEILSTIPGCQQNLVLTQTGGACEFNVLTIVEWASAQAMNAAKTIVHKKYAEEGFDPASFMIKLGVRAELGIYSSA